LGSKGEEVGLERVQDEKEQDFAVVQSLVFLVRVE
jgi:hypothetical protein